MFYSLGSDESTLPYEHEKPRPNVRTGLRVSAPDAEPVQRATYHSKSSKTTFVPFCLIMKDPYTNLPSSLSGIPNSLTYAL